VRDFPTELLIGRLGLCKQLSKKCQKEQNTDKISEIPLLVVSLPCAFGAEQVFYRVHTPSWLRSLKVHGNAKSKSATVAMAVFTPSLLTGNLVTHGGATGLRGGLYWNF